VKPKEAIFDPELPNANAVLASLCCVTARYASHPSAELAELALDLSRKLTAPQYAESKLVSEVAQRLMRDWEAIAHEQHAMQAVVVPGSRHLQ
jgi:tRNA nucleotidyltransferase (CCA-adding enzyme)